MKQPIVKKVTSTHPLLGALSAFEMIKDQVLGKEVSSRSTALTNKIGDITVDTCQQADTNTWETGIYRASIEGEWVIVTQYDSCEEATKGHQQWTDYLTENPTCELKDIDDWNLEEEEQ